MSVLLATWQLVNDQKFRGRIAAAIYKAAENIVNEGGTPESDRFKLANQVRIGPANKIDWFIWKVASNPSIASESVDGQANVPDGDIDYVVASVWDEVATDNLTVPQSMGGNDIPMAPADGPAPIAPPVTVIG